MDEKRDLDGVLRAIAEPRRRAILGLIATNELPAGEIAQHFSVTRSAVSQHLQVLKDAGLITERRDGTRRLYRASEITLGELRAFFEGLWSDSLDRARSLAEGSNGGGNGSAPH
ncbi:DNA-binding transcriptional ArsR family regulator [Nonomuraea polychroma]|uniref:DNA-binding transcriptional ArsR family regulator n=1 Tax=Nonomuraea polychroma TaxID=46176 RepID=A0A438M204_9ACTN|nr:metalloregulator ArsR/SmtB family transcription factor [Nonomuraea polychroma]RVX39794.1 DNA-binding transcriptional ArsR family regulator [Nonomuraea polychroma]